MKDYLLKPISIAPLATFRLGFGLLMVFALVRFWANGWIEHLYLAPDFHFHYQGFAWVQVPAPVLTYLLFGLCGLAALGVALGYRYRLSIVLFFLSFTYVELMDKTTYLNHYYFVSLVAFLLIWLPAGRAWSLDTRRRPDRASSEVPRYAIGALRLLVGIVYVYAGLAKLNSDWLVEAMPLKIWLMAKYDLPLLGDWLQLEWVHYAFSWTGAFFDLTVPFFLLWGRARPWAYAAVVVFHVLTWLLFPIGIFPFVMILAATVFFPAAQHRAAIQRLQRGLAKINSRWVAHRLKHDGANHLWQPRRPKLWAAGIGLFFTIQLLLPFRYLLKPGELFWTEDGYRFSWRVMLMEKAGYANFMVVDPASGRRFYVENRDFLTSFQEKQMSTQIDFILEYASHLDRHYRKQGMTDPEIYVESYVALNGRLSRVYVNPTIDLSAVDPGLAPHELLLPFEDEIRGL